MGKPITDMIIGRIANANNIYIKIIKRLYLGHKTLQNSTDLLIKIIITPSYKD